MKKAKGHVDGGDRQQKTDRKLSKKKKKKIKGLLMYRSMHVCLALVLKMLQHYSMVGTQDVHSKEKGSLRVLHKFRQKKALVLFRNRKV